MTGHSGYSRSEDEPWMIEHRSCEDPEHGFPSDVSVAAGDSKTYYCPSCNHRVTATNNIVHGIPGTLMSYHTDGCEKLIATL